MRPCAVVDPRLGSLLGRWHQWRRRFTTERRLARPTIDLRSDGADAAEYEWESQLMATLEAEIERLPRDMQLALQHLARAECMGVEVFVNPHLPANRISHERLVQRAARELAHRLEWLGLM